MGMTVGSHQVVRLSRGRHAALSEGVCAMELASMLADEPFSDRSPSISPTIGAFLRSVERERINRCLLFAMCHGTGTRSPRASLALATPEPAGAWAAMTALESGAHVDALALIDELVALGSRRGRWWQRVAGPRDEDMSRV